MFSLQRQKEAHSRLVQLKNMRHNTRSQSRSYVIKLENKVIQKSWLFYTLLLHVKMCI